MKLFTLCKGCLIPDGPTFLVRNCRIVIVSHVCVVSIVTSVGLIRKETNILRDDIKGSGKFTIFSYLKIEGWRG